MSFDDRILSVMRMREGGQSLSAIGAALGISKQGVSALIKRAEKKGSEKELAGIKLIGEADLLDARMLAASFDKSITLLDTIYNRFSKTGDKETALILIKILSELRLQSQSRSQHLKVMASLENVLAFKNSIVAALKEVCSDVQLAGITKKIEEFNE